jgi:Sec-independent protein translocase protein TatA
MGNLSFSSIILIILMVFLLIGAHAIPELGQKLIKKIRGKKQ